MGLKTLAAAGNCDSMGDGDSKCDSENQMKEMYDSAPKVQIYLRRLSFFGQNCVIETWSELFSF